MMAIVLIASVLIGLVGCETQYVVYEQACGYPDDDGDGYGEDFDRAAIEFEAGCTPAEGFVDRSGDCDDEDASINPGASESCDGVDQDCTGIVDDNVNIVWFLDHDSDGFGDAGFQLTDGCVTEAFFVENPYDCDDENGEVNPNAQEICNGLDDDCDEQTDDADPSADTGTGVEVFADVDADGYGSAQDSGWACEVPEGFVLNEEDCDDTSADVNPESLEICNFVDDNCNGVADEEALDISVFFSDADGDGFGNPNSTQEACSAPAGFVSDSTDCDDANAASFPGAEELCDALDNDCDGALSDEEVDNDEDGFNECAGMDCDDTDVNVYPGAFEVCDELDNNCNGVTDENLSQVYYVDQDGDSYGAGDPIEVICGGTHASLVDRQGDCDDADPARNPAATEVCDEIDNNCDGRIDENVGVFYADTDGDGYGDADSSMEGDCNTTNGFVGNAQDCDDADPAVNPEGVEQCGDSVDQNCDGFEESCPL